MRLGEPQSRSGRGCEERNSQTETLHSTCSLVRLSCRVSRCLIHSVTSWSSTIIAQCQKGHVSLRFLETNIELEQVSSVVTYSVLTSHSNLYLHIGCYVTYGVERASLSNLRANRSFYKIRQSVIVTNVHMLLCRLLLLRILEFSGSVFKNFMNSTELSS